MSENGDVTGAGGPPAEGQAGDRTGQVQMPLRIDEQAMQTAYANAFRTNGTPEEAVLDFGLNLLTPAAQPDAQSEMVLTLTQRIILNYYSAKRLAMALNQAVRRYEDQFGEIDLDVARRRRTGG